MSMVREMTTTAFENIDWQQFLNSPYFYGGAAAVLLILFLIIRNNATRKRLQKQIEEFQVKLNSLRSVPLPFKVTKALALSRVNKDVADTFKNCQDSFEEVQTNLKKLQDMIADSDELMQLRKHREVAVNNKDIETILAATTKTVSKLDGVLNTILEKEDQQRSRINDLKEIYHGIKMQINENPDKYLFCWEALDGIINKIDHKFSEFETIMAANDFDKATEKTEDIRSSIDNLSSIVQSIPELISVSRSEVPQMVEEVQNNYALVKQQGAYLDHLEIGKNINLINDSLQDDLRRIRQCDLDGVKEQLLDCEKRLGQLNQQIEKERSAYSELLNVKEVTSRNMVSLKNLADSLNTNFEELTARYGLDLHGENLEEASIRANELNEECHKLMNSIQSSDTPASEAVVRLSQLNGEIALCLNSVNKLSEAVRSASDDEENARSQLTKLSIVLSEVQAKIRNNRITNISNQYNDDLRKAEDYISRLETLLHEKPINVTLVNSLKTSAVELISQLYESVNRILGTAIMAENAIVLGNQYRSSYPEIDSELTRSELAYRNGEYTQALTIAINALRRLHPETVNSLLASNKESAQA